MPGPCCPEFRTLGVHPLTHSGDHRVRGRHRQQRTNTPAVPNLQRPKSPPPARRPTHRHPTTTDPHYQQPGSARPSAGRRDDCRLPPHTSRQPASSSPQRPGTARARSAWPSHAATTADPPVHYPTATPDHVSSRTAPDPDTQTRSQLPHIMRTGQPTQQDPRVPLPTRKPISQQLTNVRGQPVIPHQVGNRHRVRAVAKQRQAATSTITLRPRRQQLRRNHHSPLTSSPDHADRRPYPHTPTGTHLHAKMAENRYPSSSPASSRRSRGRLQGQQDEGSSPLTRQALQLLQKLSTVPKPKSPRQTSIRFHIHPPHRATSAPTARPQRHSTPAVHPAAYRCIVTTPTLHGLSRQRLESAAKPRLRSTRLNIHCTEIAGSSGKRWEPTGMRSTPKSSSTCSFG